MRNIVRAALLAIAAIAVAALTAVAPANAVTADMIEILSYTVTYNQGNGPDATITKILGTGVSNEFTLTLDNPSTSTKVNFFTAHPGTCYANCGLDAYSTAHGTITVTMNFKDTTTGATGSFSNVIGDYSAKYSGSHLACANDAGSAGGGQTDCIDWEGSGGYSGFSVIIPVALGADTLKVTLYNKEDWDITPQISFQLVTSATPLPGALPLFASGSGLLGFLGWRRRKRNDKAA